jgi:hypothetical protein
VIRDGSTGDLPDDVDLRHSSIHHKYFQVGRLHDVRACVPVRQGSVSPKPPVSINFIPTTMTVRTAI